MPERNETTGNELHNVVHKLRELKPGDKITLQTSGTDEQPPCQLIVRRNEDNAFVVTNDSESKHLPLIDALMFIATRAGIENQAAVLEACDKAAQESRNAGGDGELYKYDNRMTSKLLRKMVSKMKEGDKIDVNTGNETVSIVKTCLLDACTGNQLFKYSSPNTEAKHLDLKKVEEKLDLKNNKEAKKSLRESAKSSPPRFSAKVVKKIIAVLTGKTPTKEQDVATQTQPQKTVQQKTISKSSPSLQMQPGPHQKKLQKSRESKNITGPTLSG